MSAQNSRKRPAPGTTPILPGVQPSQASFVTPAEQALRWPGNATDANLAAAAYQMGAANQFLPMPSTASQGPQNVQQTQQQQQQTPSTSTVIARRPPNRALVPSAPRTYEATADPWNIFPDETGGLNNNGNNNNNNNGNNGGGLPGENESIEVLEERAQRVKKEAQTKRKQIPPFVQKLSSFLEEQKNTELIRWSEYGDSFIVLDEDEFAKTLIPELFKHNNYASFVRQLNMYGFHKRVGLSDNSMKASERKNKSPSEYYNPYFKRGHPNLLWLINKPKSGSKSKKGKKEDGDGDSDDDGVAEEPASVRDVNHLLARSVLGAQNGELGTLQRKDLQMIKEELSSMQDRQAHISKAMQRLQYDNAQLQQQARMFQNMHERHENSINAILNFLANVFRKSLEEQGGVQGVTELLASILPNGQMPQGNVVDVSDDFDPTAHAATTPTMTTMTSTPKRQQRLLPPIPVTTGAAAAAAVAAVTGQRQGSTASHGHVRTSSVVSEVSQTSPVSTVPTGGFRSNGGNNNNNNSNNSNNSSNGNGNSNHNHNHSGSIGGSVTELFDSPGNDMSSNYLQQELETNPQEGMMKIIQDTNANTPTSNGIDLSEVAASTPINLSSDQRNRVLSLMSGHNNHHNAGVGTVPSGVANLPNAAATTLPGGGMGSSAAAGVPDLPLPTAANLRGTAPMTGPGGVPMTPQIPFNLAGGNPSVSANAGIGMPPVTAGIGAGLGVPGVPGVSGVSGGVGAVGAGSVPGSVPGIVPGIPGTAPGTVPGIGTAAPLLTTASTSLSPILAQVPTVPPPPSLQDISNTQAEIEALQRLQEEQNAKISDLSNLLGPLSPSGRIPGIDDAGVGGPGQNSPGYFDLGQYLDSNAFGDDFNFATDDLDGHGAGAGAGQPGQPQPTGSGLTNAGPGVSTMSGGPVLDGQLDGDDFNFGMPHPTTTTTGQKSPSPALTEEIPRTDLLDDSTTDPSAKRRRVT